MSTEAGAIGFVQSRLGNLYERKKGRPELRARMDSAERLELLHYLVDTSGLTHSAFARVMGVSPVTMSRIYNGHRGVTSVQLRAAALAGILAGVPFKMAPASDYLPATANPAKVRARR